MSKRKKAKKIRKRLKRAKFVLKAIKCKIANLRERLDILNQFITIQDYKEQNA